MHNAADPTAGDLADWTGLTTGAVTAVIDRLEARGFVRREAHPTDRRKVLIRTIPDRFAEVSQLFTGLAEKMGTLCAGYTESELEIIKDHMVRSAEIFRSETERLRERPRGRVARPE